LFGLQIEETWLRDLAGLTVASAGISVPGTRLREQGALLLTHGGLSGPVMLRLSAWGARIMHEVDYKFPLHINWLPHLSAEEISAELQQRRTQAGARRITRLPIPPLPVRLWQHLVQAAGVPAEQTWAGLSRSHLHRFIQQLSRTTVQVIGKSLNREEFVTCGGVRLSEVNFKTMESRLCPGLFFAGELLDIDGLTGGFNFQAAWTTGWIAGRNLARPSLRPG
jgi:predicted Rossmann fold flavoprotein